MQNAAATNRWSFICTPFAQRWRKMQKMQKAKTFLHALINISWIRFDFGAALEDSSNRSLTHSLTLYLCFSFSVFLQIFAANTADNKLVSRQRCHHRRRLVALQSIHLQRGAGEAQCALFRPVPLRGVRRCARVQADR